MPVPYGFATTAHGYRHFMEVNGLNEKVNALLATLKDPEDSEELHRVCSQIRKIMREAPMPEDLAEDIGNSYDELAKMTGQNEPYVAVRSSATAEDLPDLHCREQDTYLN